MRVDGKNSTSAHLCTEFFCIGGGGGGAEAGGGAADGRGEDAEEHADQHQELTPDIQEHWGTPQNQLRYLYLKNYLNFSLTHI